MVGSCNFCCSDAVTERSRVPSKTTLALCRQCARVWDTATAAQIASTNAAKPVDDPVNAALRYLVRNTLPQELSGYREQERLLEPLTCESRQNS